MSFNEILNLTESCPVLLAIVDNSGCRGFGIATPHTSDWYGILLREILAAADNAINMFAFLFKY